MPVPAPPRATSDTTIRMRFSNFSYPLAALLLISVAFAQSPKDSATFDPDGTAHVTRVVPMPSTVSPEAQTWLGSLPSATSGPESLAERRVHTDAWRAQDSAEVRKLYPVNIEATTTAGIRSDI